MIRAVVDPGVLVSAFIGREGSVPDRIVRAWRSGEVEFVVSEALLAELAGVLARPKFAAASRGGRDIDFAGAIRAGSSLVADIPASEPITRDPKDDYLVMLARVARASVVVSGDGDLLEAELDDVEVVTPRAFIDGLEADR